jgi:hypothetical protein
MHPTPLRGPEIVAILKAEFVRVPSRSISASRLNGNPLAGALMHRRHTYAIINEKDYERRITTSEGMVYLASTRRMLHWLDRHHKPT